MADYIRKADAVDAVEFGITLASAINIETGERTELFQRENDELREAVKRIKDIEPADVVQVVHAYWIQTSAEDEDGNAYYSCSNCGSGESHNPIVEVPYCWKCGAKMDAHGEE